MKNGEPMMQWKYYSIDGDDHWSKPYALLQKTPSLEECKLTLVPNKSLDDDEMKGLDAFISHVTRMMEKYLEQSDKNEAIIRSTESLVQN